MNVLRKAQRALSVPSLWEEETVCDRGAEGMLLVEVRLPGGGVLKMAQCGEKLRCLESW